ncbi:MAG: hypothetical protein ACTS6H_01070 [Candidatus Hodgkinia cicadicola]
MKVTWPQKRSTLTTCAAPAADESLLPPSRGAAVGRNLVSWTNVGRPTDDWEKAKTSRKVQSRRPVKFIGTGSGGTFAKHFTD